MSDRPPTPLLETINPSADIRVLGKDRVVQAMSGLPDRFQDHFHPNKQYDETGPNAPQIVETALRHNAAVAAEAGALA